MAGDDQAAKDRIEQGMSKSGKQEKGKAGGDAAKGQRGHGADPSNVGRDMAKSGSGGGGTKEQGPRH